MSESDRTSITLTKILWDLVDDCVGTIGYNRSQVIGIILHDYFQNPDKLRSIKELKIIREENLKRTNREKTKESNIIEQKITEVLSFSEKITIDFFIDYLEITLDYFKKNVFEWSQKFNFIIDDQIIKKKING